MTNLIKAVLAVMDEVKSIEKNLDVGTGRASYKGVADKDVKQAIGQAMQKYGLIILTTGIMPESEMSEWDQEETFNGQTQMKHKTMVFTKIKTKYTLMHESGEQIELVGYGHGVDSQDKSAGKATTYALKYALLNTFLVPTGDIDDTDSEHSNSLPQKPLYATKTVSKPQNGTTGRSCLRCGAELVHNPKTGKFFCKDKCWLKTTIPEDETPIPVEEDELGKQVSDDIPF